MPLETNPAGRVDTDTIRQAIAERHGWKVEYDEYEYEYGVFSTKDRSEWGRWDTEQQAIANLPGGDYCHDIKSAMKMLAEVDSGWTLSSCLVMVDDICVAYDGNQLPVAICVALLAYWGIDNLTVDDVEST